MSDIFNSFGVKNEANAAAYKRPAEFSQPGSASRLGRAARCKPQERINTSVATCIITALGTIGSLRQKQMLRLSGAFAGGFLVSLPAQVYLLPQMNSIAVLPYFRRCFQNSRMVRDGQFPPGVLGLQLALAFYLVNLQEPFEQISLSIARDRVIGVLLGLVMMWIVFDRIASQRAIERMDALLRANLRMLGDLACAVADGNGILEETSSSASSSCAIRSTTTSAR